MEEINGELPICQSCAMPMGTDEDRGTEADGTKSMEYCNFCYQNGVFTDEGITLEEKIEKNVELAKAMGIPENEAREIAKNEIPPLKRWS